MKHWLAFAAACFAVSFLPNIGPAAPDAAAERPGAFVVTAVAPAEEIGETGDFRLSAEAGGVRTLTARVYNGSDAPMEVRVAAVNAATGTNGKIAFRKGGAGGGNPAFSTLARVKTGRLWVRPHESETARVVLAMPEHLVAGDILGGISFTRVPAYAGGGGSAAAVRVIPVRLSGGAVEQRFDITGITLQAVGGRGALVYAVDNQSPLVVSGLTLRVEVYQGGVLVLEEEKTGVEMAPASVMRYAVQMPGRPLPAADYESRVSLALADGREWQFTRAFSVTQADVAEISRLTRQNLSLGVPVWALLVTCGVGAAVITLCAFTLTSIWAEQRRMALLARQALRR